MTFCVHDDQSFGKSCAARAAQSNTSTWWSSKKLPNKIASNQITMWSKLLWNRIRFLSMIQRLGRINKIEIFLDQREVAFLSPSKICENSNFSTVYLWKFKFSQILLGDKNAAYLCSKIISTLPSFLVEKSVAETGQYYLDVSVFIL